VTEFALPAIYVLFVWWFSTGAVLYLNNLPQYTYKWSFLGVSAVLGGSVYGLYVTSHSDTILSAYLSFTFGILAWAWTQYTFFTGLITGPRTTPCPSTCKGPRHFVHAIETSMYHEICTALLGVVICFTTMTGKNHIGSWTYTIIWLMHSSAKVNAVLGVRNLNDHFFPEHLRYISAFLKKRSMNMLFPLSISISTVAVAVLWHKAIEMQHDRFELLSFTFYIVILALGIIEHWFLVLPIPAEALWNWSVKASKALTGPEFEEIKIVETGQPAPVRAPAYEKLEVVSGESSSPAQTPAPARVPIVATQDI
jgi:putative photosynthetic complex assembly protein 2